MHVGIAHRRWRGKRSWHSRGMWNPQLYVSGKRPMLTLSKTRLPHGVHLAWTMADSKLVPSQWETLLQINCRLPSAGLKSRISPSWITACWSTEVMNGKKSVTEYKITDCRKKSITIYRCRGAIFLSRWTCRSWPHDPTPTYHKTAKPSVI